MQPNYLDRVKDNRSTAAVGEIAAAEQKAMLAELRKMQMATMMGQQKPGTVVITGTEQLGIVLGKKIDEMATTVTKVLAKLDSSEMDKQELAAIASLEVAIKELITITKANKPSNTNVVAAIKALKLDTVVNVPKQSTPTVTVQERAIDFTPLIRALTPPTPMATAPLLEEYPEEEAPDTIDLDCYHASDIKEDGKIQYIGFINPEGGWYIMENDMANNQIRYVFGTDGYAVAFESAAQYEYHLLNEAIHEV